MSDTNQPEQHALGKRIVREATPEERERHAGNRAAIEAERPEIAAWAREEHARAGGRVPVGTVFTTDETRVLEAIDAYAASHNLPSRSAVVRQALSKLLDIRVEVEPKQSA